MTEVTLTALMLLVIGAVWLAFVLVLHRLFDGRWRW